jgi:uncharacterized membrane protein
MGVTIRHFFNTMHAKGGYKWWTWGATAAIFAVIVWLSVLPLMREEPVEEAALTPQAERFAAHAAFPDVASVVIGNCSYCHAREVTYPGLAAAPGGMILDSDAAIATHAMDIYLQAGVSHAMPPGRRGRAVGGGPRADPDVVSRGDGRRALRRPWEGTRGTWRQQTTH